MKEWRTTVWDYVREVKGGRKAQLFIVLLLLIVILVIPSLLALKNAVVSAYKEELDAITLDWLREGEYRKSYRLVFSGLGFADDMMQQRVCLAYANDRYAAGDYREAAEVYFRYKELTGISGNLEKALQLYAEELRAAGDEDGAEKWLEYVQQKWLELSRHYDGLY